MAESEAPATPQSRETSTCSGGRRKLGEVFLGADGRDGTGKLLALSIPAIQPDHAGAGWVAHAVEITGQAADVAVARVTTGRPSR